MIPFLITVLFDYLTQCTNAGHTKKIVGKTEKVKLPPLFQSTKLQRPSNGVAIHSQLPH